MAKLSVTTGKSVGKTADFDKTAIIGRGETAQLQISDIKASREHCKVFDQGGQWVVADLNSRNGIKVNGIQTTRKNLAAGDVIEIGETKVVFELSGVGAKSAPAQPSAPAVEEIEIEESPAAPRSSAPSSPAVARPLAPAPAQSKSGSSATSKKEAAMADARASAAKDKAKTGARAAATTKKSGGTATKAEVGLQVSDHVLQFNKVDTKNATLMDIDLSQSTGTTQFFIWLGCLMVLGVIIWAVVQIMG